MGTSTEEKKLYLDFAQFIVILIGGIYAYFKIWKEGIFRPRIQVIHKENMIMY